MPKYVDQFTAGPYQFNKLDEYHWVDQEGVKIDREVFLKKDLLISLKHKKHIQAASFRGQELLTNADNTLFQIGKVVFTEHLKPLNINGQNATHLCGKMILFGDGTVLHEVEIGLNKKRFYDVQAKDIYKINNEIAEAHISCLQFGDVHLEGFKTVQNKYFLNASDQSIFKLEHIHPHHITHIDVRSIRNKNSIFWNMSAGPYNFVYDANHQRVFTLNEGLSHPDKISPADVFIEHIGVAHFKNGARVFQWEESKIQTIDGLEIKSITSNESQGKLLNCVNELNQVFVVDARRGVVPLKAARSSNALIHNTVGEPYSLGGSFYQNVDIQSLGGPTPRVVRLNEDNLMPLNFPDELKAHPDGEAQSIYAGSPLLNIDAEQVLEIGNKKYLRATFLPYFDIPTKIFLDQVNPFRLEGIGHKYEIVLEIKESQEEKYVGDHLMLSAQTLTEENKQNQILFSNKTMESWIRFEDDYLPLMRRFVDAKKLIDYHLIELQSLSTRYEYLVVEKKEPHRLMCEKTKEGPKPKLIQSEEDLEKSLEEKSFLSKLFNREEITFVVV